MTTVPIGPASCATAAVSHPSTPRMRPVTRSMRPRGAPMLVSQPDGPEEVDRVWDERDHDQEHRQDDRPQRDHAGDGRGRTAWPAAPGAQVLIDRAECGDDDHPYEDGRGDRRQVDPDRREDGTDQERGEHTPADRCKALQPCGHELVARHVDRRRRVRPGLGGRSRACHSIPAVGLARRSVHLPDRPRTHAR